MRFFVLWLGSFRFLDFYFVFNITVIGGFRVYSWFFCRWEDCGVGFVFGRARLFFELCAFLLAENERSVRGCVACYAACGLLVKKLFKKCCLCVKQHHLCGVDCHDGERW